MKRLFTTLLLLCFASVAFSQVVANDDLVYTPGDSAVEINVLFNDLNFGPSTINSSIVSNPSTGTLQLNQNGTITYLPNAGFIGVDGFFYSICTDDIIPICDTGYVVIEVGVSLADNNDYFNINASNLPGSAGNVLTNSLYNFSPTTISDVTISVNIPAVPINGGTVPELQTSTGNVLVPIGAIAGVYTIAYTITDVNLVNVSSVATILVSPSSTGISGTVFYDTNSDCVQDLSDLGANSVLIQLLDANLDVVAQTYTGVLGEYFFNAPDGNYTVQLINSSNLDFSCPTGGSIATSVSNGSITENINFGFNCMFSNFDVGISAIWPVGIVFPGQVHSLNTYLANYLVNYGACYTNSNLLGGILTIDISGPVDYLGPAAGAITPNVVSGNTLSYVVTDFSTVDLGSFSVLLGTQTSAQLGDLIVVTVTYNTNLAGDLNRDNNTFVYIYEALNSYDPNEKQVSPPGDVLIGYDDNLIYTIYFQNLGNAPAFNITLKDTLSANLNLGTFEKMGSSHACDVNIYGNELTVFYPNIMLADSASNPEGSIGFFQYRIHPIAGLQVGQSIDNTAHIFFDFNPAVVTNTVVTNYIEDQTEGINELSQNKIKIYPNPNKGIFTIQLDESITGTIQCEILDLSGKKVSSQEKLISNGNIEFNGKLDGGVYFIRINDLAKGQDYFGKIVVE